MEIPDSLELASFLSAPSFFWMNLEALEAQGWRAEGEGYWARKTPAQALINLKQQQLWVKEIRAVQDIPSAAEVAETIFHALGCYGKYT